MSQTATIQIKIDPQLKNQAQVLFEDMGLTLGDAIKLLIKQCIKTNSIPFTITAGDYFDQNSKKEISESIKRVNKGQIKEFQSETDMINHFNSL